ncbi:MAG TPA: acetate kinase [Paludibacteraceae bacterium]|jgi:acetate kinase|nr:acetate kinase [Paludibacteraceae bacterium]MBP9017317.1 acetate kinase [Paludibacteraceae bacterium]MDS1031191.1 acetate kinase [Porphyromonadaceae sp. NP-X]HNZ61900.1 acetate kinase [Paludibacteraceae bacterium]HOH55037.1 acetate kinase [Paludibacteraceae bacterium]
MKILVLNCGSSSVKYRLLDLENNKVLGSGGVEKIGMKGSFLKHIRQDHQTVILEGEVLEHQTAIEYILGVLTSAKHGCIKSLEEIDAVGHRVVHGAEKFNSSVLITNEVIKKIEECIDIAPLHNPPNLAGISAISELLPTVPQVAVFDTAFHQTMPEYAFMYPIPYSLYTKYGIRRYGFHGTSHRYVSHRACEFLNMDYNRTKIITVHLGNGASITAIENGKSIDTSMGFTPLEGLMMGTRSGDVDLGIATFLMEKEMIGPSALSTLFNKHSGVLGVSGISSDMRDIETAIANGNERAKLALDMYEYRIKKYIGAYVASLNGVDLIVFTGGVGENQASTRQKIMKGLTYLGVEIDEEANASARGKEALISSAGSKVKVAVIPTDEEFMIASDTMKIIEEMKKK